MLEPERTSPMDRQTPLHIDTDKNFDGVELKRKPEASELCATERKPNLARRGGPRLSREWRLTFRSSYVSSEGHPIARQSGGDQK